MTSTFLLTRYKKTVDILFCVLTNGSFSINLLIQCVVSFCQKEKKCPHPGCSISVSPNSSTIQWFEAILDEMFREYATVYTPPGEKSLGEEFLNITVLNGDATKIPYSSLMPMSVVQNNISEKLHIPPNKQKILYNDKIVQVLLFTYIHIILLSLEDLKTFCT